MKSLNLLIGLMIAMLLSACETAYIIDEMAYYSRKIGMVDDFNIARWHNMAFARESTFTIAALVDDDIAQVGLINSTEKAFQGYFAATSSTLSRSQSKALKMLKELVHTF